MSETSSRVNHQDILIGTLAPFNGIEHYLPQIVNHGFESFELTAWAYNDGVNYQETAKKVLDIVEGKAIISSIGVYGNPLQDEKTAKTWEDMILNAAHFGCNVVCGFAGALEDRPVPESMPKYKEVFGRLGKLAEDNGVRIAFENCDMGGTWEAPKWNIAHSPSAWEMMFNEVETEAIGLEWEPCHQLNSLVDPIPQLRKYVNRVYHVHGKDATIAWDVIESVGIRGGQPYVWHRTPGFGDSNWTDIITILRMAGYQGAIDIEGWHDPVYRDELEMTGQVYALGYLQSCRGGDFIPNPVTKK